MFDVTEIGIQLFAAVVLPWAFAMARKYAKNAELAAVLDRLERGAVVAVRSVQQTYVADIKRARMDGSLTAEERHRARQAALISVRNQLGAAGLGVLARGLGVPPASIDGVIASHLEATLMVEQHNDAVLRTLEVEAIAAVAGSPE